jgi:UDP-N-acetylglucosamine acyltransferase
MSDVPTNTVGGGIDQTAVIGHAPEHRLWTPDMPSFTPQIDPSARIEAFCTVDAGFKAPTAIGPRSWLMKRVHIGHDALIGADCELAPGACIGGHVQIGDRVRIGMNATIRPGIIVGDDAVIGMGSAVTHNVPAGQVWYGNPARRSWPKRTHAGPHVTYTVNGSHDDTLTW